MKKLRYLWNGKFYYIDFSTDNLRYEFENWEARKTTPLEWFTGLFDKNNIEIYEHDIIKFSGANYKTPFEIVFINGAFCIKTHGETIQYKEENTVSINRAIHEAKENNIDFFQKIVVIGNIHQNSELLK